MHPHGMYHQIMRALGQRQRVRIADQRRSRVQCAPDLRKTCDNRRRFKASVNQSKPIIDFFKGGTVQKQGVICGAAAVAGQGRAICQGV